MTGDKRDSKQVPSGRDTSTAETIATTLRQASEQLTDGGFEDGFFSAVVEKVGVGVGVYEATGHFTYVNQAYADLVGMDRDELCGSTVWAVNPTVEEHQFEEYWHSFDLGETRQRETIHSHSDGAEIPVETHTTAIEVDGTRYHVGTIADISERVEGWEKLERQDERLEQFASVVSHDLRNPLNVAMGRLKLAQETTDPEHLDHVEQSLTRIEALIEDVLTMARDGNRISEPEPVELDAIVHRAWRSVGTRDGTLVTEDELGTVQSDENRLLEVFENLFDNAVEHGVSDKASIAAGPDDAVEHSSTSPHSNSPREDAVEHDSDVTVRIGRSEDGLYVADDGPGIPEDERDDVTEYGYTTTEDGTGFGLTIVEQIVTAHGWAVTLSESDDGGVRVELTDIEFE